jgi:hypothetical protein
MLDLIVNRLAQSGSVPIGALYDPPVSDKAPGGPEDLFTGCGTGGAGQAV